MAKVDIIVPAYNASRFLAAALDSVEAQTFTDWRILLIDDGSTDDTPTVLAPYRERLEERLLYTRQANAGMCAARNAALSQASADYIALLDADDVWLPERLEESVRALEANPAAGLSYGFVARIDAQGNVVSRHDQLKPKAEGWIARPLYTRDIDLPCPTITFRASLIQEMGGFDEALVATEDRDLWLRIAVKHPVVRIPKIIAHYRISPGALTSDLERMSRGQMQFITKHRGAPGCDEPAYREALSSVHRQRAEVHASRGDVWKAWKEIPPALRLHLSRQNWQAAVYVLKRSLMSVTGWRRQTGWGQ